MNRIEFPRPTVKIIEERAGHQCSFPTCNRRTSGPGFGKDQVSRSGIAAHIYSASPQGPRGQGGLSPDELKQPENGIWLCSVHAKLVDNNQGSAFPPETLLSYKALQEARVIREHQGLYSPIGWIHELTLYDTPIFKPNQTVRLAKLNLIFGDNESGKTALTQWIAGSFDSSYFKRWQSPHSLPVHFRLSYLYPEQASIEIKIESDKSVHYRINNLSVAFNPIQLRVFSLTDIVFNEKDDLLVISNALNVPNHVVLNLINEIHAFPHARVRNLRFEKDHEDCLNELLADVDGTAPGRPLRSLSGRETERVFIEFATAAARISGRYAPTLLILDGCPLILFEGIFDFYSHHLLDPENQFQTIMCIPSRKLDLDSLRWRGWEVIRTLGFSTSVMITQELRAK